MHKRKHHRNNYLIGTKTSRNAKAAALDKHFKILQEILASSMQGTTFIESNTNARSFYPGNYKR